MGNDFEGALGWDSTIEKDDEFILLPEGEYSFEVKILEKARFDGSEKMCACPKANLTLMVFDPVSGNGGQVKDSMMLHAKSEWKLSQFFTSIGMKKKGEKLQMRWNDVVGCTGKLRLVINEYTKNDGTKAQNNRVDRYLPPAEPAQFAPGKF